MFTSRRTLALPHVVLVVLAESIDDMVVSISVRHLSHESSQQPVGLELTQVNPSRLRLLLKCPKFFGQCSQTRSADPNNAGLCHI